MKRSEIRILIVEDDETLGRALSEALRRAGYQVKLVSSPDEAINATRAEDFKVAIVDCLLPKTNGVELGGKLKSCVGDDLRLILISGIYKDKTFSRDAIQKTNAARFLTKPFDLDKFTATVDETLGELLEADLPPLIDTLTMREIGPAERTKALENCNALHGFDLPMVYSLLFGSNLSGLLNVVTSDGEVSVLTFQSGKLTQVQLKDSTSYFGVLLVEMGFTTPEEVEEVLAEQGKDPIGERLVAAHSLSPHAIRLVREEQMLIRLSKTVQDTFVDATFTPTEVSNSDVGLDRERFTQLLWDWICSKISIDWLKGFYGRWLEYPAVVVDSAAIKRRLETLPGVAQQVEPIVRALGEGKPIADIIEQGQFDEDRLLPVLHLLLIEKLAYFGPRRTSKEDASRRIQRLKKIIAESANRDFFQLLGVSPKVGEREIGRHYVDLAKIFHPDRIEPNAPAELRELAEKYFARITEAYETLKDPEKRQAYLRELNEGSAEKVLLNESIFEQAQTYLRKGKFQLALDHFSKLAAQRQHRSDLFIYLSWAKMKVGVPEEKLEKFLQSISESLNKVPPEERHSAPYFYTKGLFYTQIGDLEKAKTNFKHALVLDNNFVEARRELAIVRSRLKSKSDSFSELSTVVTKFFSRRKRR